MTIPLSKLVGGSERAGEPLKKTGTVERGPSTPPPLPSTAAPESAVRFPANAARAPTLRPPAAALQAAALQAAVLQAAAVQAAEVPASRVLAAVDPAAARPSSRPPSEGGAERIGLGFTSVIRHLSLRGWLRWIYSNRSDAALRVRTREGGSGNIWCSAGKIVDADWGELTAEEALQEMLQLSSGAVTIDFDPVDRPRRIIKTMHELLHMPAGGSERVGDLAQLETALGPTPVGTSREQPFRNSLFIPLPEEAPASPARQAWRAARRLSRAEYLAGGVSLAVLVVAAFAYGRLRGSSEADTPSAPNAEPPQQTKALLPPPSSPSPGIAPPGAPGPTPARDLPVISFVALEVEPTDAQIWLDQALVGLGRFELAPIPDGAMHELRFVAAGYETRSLYFVGTPPAGRVLLERAVERTSAPAALDGSKPDPQGNDFVEGSVVRGDGAQERALVRNVPRRHAPVPAPVRARERAPTENAASVAKAPQVKASAQIQVIEARTPRVQVLE